jgi:MFS family permease
MSGAAATGDRAMPAIDTAIPARLDRLPWSRFHLLVVIALGITWVLDGLEVTIVGSIGPALQDHAALGLSAADIGTAASCYVLGAVCGAICFGWLTDRFGRRLVFNLTLAIYVGGVILTAFSFNLWSFCAFRLITGAGIGGEYAAINSAIDELIPARLRGRIDLIVNGTFWAGAVAGSSASLLLLDRHLLGPDLGWRLGFGIGGVLGLVILLLRRFVPESPRWLVTHGRNAEAERVTGEIESRVEHSTHGRMGRPDGTLTVHPRRSFGFGVVLRSMLGEHRSRSLLALVLMIAQAFLFNAVFFTYGLVLDKFYHVPSRDVGLYIIPLAATSFCGPLLLGRLFDTVGRRRMIGGTFALSGALLIAVAILFGLGALDARTQTIAWMVIFFFASAAASSAYLTASEIFPLETRALAIAMFYAIGTAGGGVLAPLAFGWLIGTGSPWAVAGGYLASAVLMLLAAVTEARFGIDAEGKSLESVAKPLSG